MARRTGNGTKHANIVMPRLRRDNGFTLIEIMVVVAIISVMVALIGVRISRDTDRLARLEAQRFVTIVNQIRDESIITGRVFAVNFDELGRSYTFYQNPAEWAEIKGDRLFKPRKMPEGVGMEITIERPVGNDDEDEERNTVDDDQSNGEEGAETAEAEQKGAVLTDYSLISPVGEMTPFTLILSGDEYRYQVSLNDEQVLVSDRAQ